MIAGKKAGWKHYWLATVVFSILITLGGFLYWYFDGIQATAELIKCLLLGPLVGGLTCFAFYFALPRSHKNIDNKGKQWKKGSAITLISLIPLFVVALFMIGLSSAALVIAWVFGEDAGGVFEPAFSFLINAFAFSTDVTFVPYAFGIIFIFFPLLLVPLFYRHGLSALDLGIALIIGDVIFYVLMIAFNALNGDFLGPIAYLLGSVSLLSAAIIPSACFLDKRLSNFDQKDEK